MSNVIKESASYIVSNEILQQTREFTIEEIFKNVQSQLISLFENIGSLRRFIEEKVNSLCELGLISGTGIFYYVVS